MRLSVCECVRTCVWVYCVCVNECGLHEAPLGNPSSRNLSQEETDRIPCVQCDQNCASASKLTTHARTRMSNPLCACPAGFAQAGHLTTWGEEPFVCGTCGKGFADSSHLVAHAQTHPGENRSCATCGKGSAEAGDSTMHVWTHTGEKPYVRDVCQQFDDACPYQHRRETQHVRVRDLWQGLCSGRQFDEACPNQHELEALRVCDLWQEVGLGPPGPTRASRRANPPRGATCFRAIRNLGWSSYF